MAEVGSLPSYIGEGLTNIFSRWSKFSSGFGLQGA
jgi:hypothetical protein